ncbi:SDR family oxidoreductase [Gemella morbillorum]|uniref:SDR family oxidoreductase n=1 Tax=Gemella morbillorum TaxID=29391 RepID=UPI00248EA8E3|nr:SDR family oxidoreductase [Gemella morbillorum]
MIGVTGVTGKLGGQVAKVLSQKGLKAVHIARSPERAIKYDNAEIRKASYENSEESRKTLEGIKTLLMVSAKENPKRVEEHHDFIDAAKIVGVEHIVYISFYNNKKDATFTLSRDHYQTEKYIKEQGLKYTFLRDNFYIDFFLDLCFEYGEIRGPAGDGLVSAVARRDAADIVVAVMLNVQEYENKVLNLTGPRDLSMKNIVKVVGEKLGKEIFYINETVEEAYESRKVWEAEQWQYDSWVSTYTAIAKGEQSGVSLDIEKILNRPATSLEDLVKEYVK